MLIAFVEHTDNRLDDPSLEALTVGRQLAAQTNVPLHAALVGSASNEMVERLGAFGVTTLHVAEHEQLNAYAPAAFAASLAELLNVLKPEALLAAGTERGNEILAHVGARTNLPFAANCTEVTPGEVYSVTRLRWGGSLLEEAKLAGATKLLTVAPNSIPIAPGAPVQVTVQRFTPQLSERDFRVRVTSRVASATGKVSLAGARVVVGGGAA